MISLRASATPIGLPSVLHVEKQLAEGTVPMVALIRMVAGTMVAPMRTSTSTPTRTDAVSILIPSPSANMPTGVPPECHLGASLSRRCACVIETESMATVYLRPHSHHLCVAVTYTRERSTQRLLCQCAQHQHEERSVWRARQRLVSHGRVGWVWVGRADGAGAPCRR